MMDIRRLRHCATWVALFAILLNTFVPTLARAATPPGTAPRHGAWIELCAVSGSKWVRLDADGRELARVDAPAGEPDAPSVAGHGGDCPYCSAHGASVGLPPSTHWMPSAAQAGEASAFPPATPLLLPTPRWDHAARAPPIIA